MKPAPPDAFRDAVAPREAVERALAAELAHAMSQILALPLAESARRGLDRELENAHGTAERLQVLDRRLVAMSQTFAVSAGYAARAELRSAAPRQESERHVIWRKPWRPDE